MDWEAEAKFWQMKYFEQLAHSNSIIGHLARPTLAQTVADQLAKVQDQKRGQPIPDMPSAPTQRLAQDLAGVEAMMTKPRAPQASGVTP